MQTTAEHVVNMSLSVQDWVKIVIFGLGQLIGIGVIAWKAAWAVSSRVERVESGLDGLRLKVNEVIVGQLEGHDRRITRLEDKTFPITDPRP